MMKCKRMNRGNVKIETTVKEKNPKSDSKTSSLKKAPSSVSKRQT